MDAKKLIGSLSDPELVALMAAAPDELQAREVHLPSPAVKHLMELALRDTLEDALEADPDLGKFVLEVAVVNDIEPMDVVLGALDLLSRIAQNPHGRELWISTLDSSIGYPLGFELPQEFVKS